MCASSFLPGADADAPIIFQDLRQTAPTARPADRAEHYFQENSEALTVEPEDGGSAREIWNNGSRSLITLLYVQTREPRYEPWDYLDWFVRRLGIIQSATRKREQSARLPPLSRRRRLACTTSPPSWDHRGHDTKARRV